MNKDLQKLVFVYNADSGKRNAVLDTMHKILSPSTYNCNLCDITFGLFGEKKDWQGFRNRFPIEMDFLHRDEFNNAYASKFGSKYTFPIVLGANSGEFEVVVATEELNQLQDAAELMAMIEKRAVTG